MFSFIQSGYLGNVAVLTIIVGITFAAQKKYKFLAFLIIPLLVGFQIQGIKADFRKVIWAPDTDLKVEERVGLLFQLLLHGPEQIENIAELSQDTILDDDSPEGVFSGIESSYARISDDSMEIILANTPSNVPFWDGKTYESLLYLAIPRFLFPDKPTRDFNNEFGRRYRIVQEGDEQTNISINFLAEGYMNFGYAGMYGIAVIFGLLLAIVELLSRRFFTAPYLFTYILFLKPFLFLESDLAHSLGELMIAVGLAAILYLLLLRTNRMKLN